MATARFADVAARLASLADEGRKKHLDAEGVALLVRDACALSPVDQARLLTDASELLEHVVDSTEEVRSAVRTSKARVEDVQQQVFSGCVLGRWYGRQYVEEVSLPGLEDSLEDVAAAFRTAFALMEAGPASSPAHRAVLLLVQASQRLASARQELARCQRHIAAGTAVLQRRTASWGCLS